jgi:hypothetical protein
MRNLDPVTITYAELEDLQVDAERYRWLRENGEQGIYVLRNWKQGDDAPPLALAQRAELDTVIDEYLSGARGPQAGLPKEGE